MDRLTDVNYWEEQWWKKAHAQRLRLYRDFDYETVQLLRKAAGPPPAHVIELGAGGSRVLPYLKAKFGYEVYGTDFSPGGCRLLRSNFALAGVAGGVVCEDIFQPALAPGCFDLVFSSGLIEHFKDTRAAVALHARLARPGGRVVLIVPNLQGFQGKIWRRLAPPLWARHKVFGPHNLAAVLRECGLSQTRSGYLGSFFVHLNRGEDWTIVRRWPALAQALACGMVRVMSGGISFAFRLSPLRPHSRAFSTAFYASGSKPAPD